MTMIICHSAHVLVYLYGEVSRSEIAALKSELVLWI